MPFGYDDYYWDDQSEQQNPYLMSRLKNIMGGSNDQSPSGITEGLGGSRAYKRLFQVPQTQEQTTPTPTPDQAPNQAGEYYKSVVDMMNNRPQRDKMQQMVAEEPRYQDYAPSRKNRFGAAIVAALSAMGGDISGGMKAGAAVRDRDYNRAESDWHQRMRGQQQLSGAESQDIDAKIKAMEIGQKLGIDWRQLNIGERGAAVGERNAATAEARTPIEQGQLAESIRNAKAREGLTLSEQMMQRENYKSEADLRAAQGRDIPLARATANRNAASGEVSAAASAQSSATGVKAEEEKRDYNRRLFETKDATIDPKDRAQAYLEAIKEVSLTPEFGQFLDVDKKKGTVTPKGSLSDVIKKKMSDEIERRAIQILKQRKPKELKDGTDPTSFENRFDVTPYGLR